MSVNVTVVDRDLFYELIRDWQECHMTPGWNMLETQGEKICHLVGYRTELANHIHFARLFQSQLIQVRHRDCGLVIETLILHFQLNALLLLICVPIYVILS